MTQLLAIKAHPMTGETSRSVRLFDEFLDAYRKANPDDTITIINLYEEAIPEIDGEILLAWQQLRSGTDFSTLSASQQAKIKAFDASTAQFLAADKIVISNALWNLNIPTRLKAWFDTINVAGKTFRYTETGPVPMTEGKKALHIQSNGGVYQGQDFASQYVKQILQFVGVAEVEQLFVEGIDHHPEQGEAIMAEASAKAQELAQTF